MWEESPNFNHRESTSTRLPRWLSGKEFACQCRRHRRWGFNPRVEKIPWRRKWQPTPVFLPGKFHGQSPWGRKASDRTGQLCTHTTTLRAGKGKGEGISKWVAFAHFKMFVLARYLPIRIWAEITMEKHTYSVYYYRIFLKSLLTLLPYYFCLILGYLALRLVRSGLPKQGSNAYPLHWKVQSDPLDHQGIPCF